MRADPKHLGAQIGFLSVLHTWGQTLQPHPHVHCVVPGGGLSPDHQQWIRAPNHFFLPVKVLSPVFRGKFVAGLRRAFRRNQLVFFGACRPLAQEKAFAAFLRTLFHQDWVVYAKKPFGGPEHVLHYLARYTHRVAISNHRLVEVPDANVTFRWKDYAHHSKRRTMTLTLEEFLRRFLQHVLPRGFPRIRYFGFLANRRRTALLPLCRTLLAVEPPPVPAMPAAKPILWLCPACQGPMRVLERLTANQLRTQLRHETRPVEPLDSSSSTSTSGHLVCLRPRLPRTVSAPRKTMVFYAQTPASCPGPHAFRMVFTLFSPRRPTLRNTLPRRSAFKTHR